jgi:seryl-tRNA(Sec) selenium transferase
MIHELAGLGTGSGETGTPHNIVETLLQKSEQVLTSDAGSACGLFVVATELAFEDAVHRPQLLLLAELHEIVALTDSASPVLARGIGTAIDGATFRLAELGPGAPTRLVTGTCVPTHQCLTS